MRSGSCIVLRLLPSETHADENTLDVIHDIHEIASDHTEDLRSDIVIDVNEAQSHVTTEDTSENLTGEASIRLGAHSQGPLYRRLLGPMILVIVIVWLSLAILSPISS